MDGLSVCLSVCALCVCVCFFFSEGLLCLCFRVLGLLRNFFFSKREGGGPLHPHPSGVGPRATPLFGGYPLLYRLGGWSSTFFLRARGGGDGVFGRRFKGRG